MHSFCYPTQLESQISGRAVHTMRIHDQFLKVSHYCSQIDPSCSQVHNPRFGFRHLFSKVIQESRVTVQGWRKVYVNALLVAQLAALVQMILTIAKRPYAVTPFHTVSLLNITLLLLWLYDSMSFLLTIVTFLHLSGLVQAATILVMDPVLLLPCMNDFYHGSLPHVYVVSFCITSVMPFLATADTRVLSQWLKLTQILLGVTGGYGFLVPLAIARVHERALAYQVFYNGMTMTVCPAVVTFSVFFFHPRFMPKRFRIAPVQQSLQQQQVDIILRTHLPLLIWLCDIASDVLDQRTTASPSPPPSPGPANIDELSTEDRRVLQDELVKRWSIVDEALGDPRCANDVANIIEELAQEDPLGITSDETDSDERVALLGTHEDERRTFEALRQLFPDETFDQWIQQVRDAGQALLPLSSSARKRAHGHASRTTSNPDSGESTNGNSSSDATGNASPARREVEEHCNDNSITGRSINDEKWQAFCSCLPQGLASVPFVQAYRTSNGRLLRCSCAGHFIGATYFQDTIDKSRFREVYLIAVYARRFQEEHRGMCNAFQSAMKDFHANISKAKTIDAAHADLNALIDIMKKSPYRDDVALVSFLTATLKWPDKLRDILRQNKINDTNHARVIREVKRFAKNSLDKVVLDEIARNLTEAGHPSHVVWKGMYLNATYEIRFCSPS